MEIEFVIRTLKLFDRINCTDIEKDGILFNCSTAVNEKEIESKDGKYISYDPENKNTVIPEGNYLFIQGALIPEDEGYPLVKEVYDAAEKLWLEFLWQEKRPAGNEIYMRVLKEHSMYVFQLLRPVQVEENT